LFAGLEVDFHELAAHWKILTQHIIISVIMLVMLTMLLIEIFAFEVRPSALIALALITPSAGFILDSIDVHRLSKNEKFWIKAKAISTELVALVTLFFVLQSDSIGELAISSAVLIGMIFLLPVIFRFFSSIIAPYAPRSEFGFLIMIAFLCAMLTRKIGTYYLVGAFVVGVTAQRFRKNIPEMVSEPMLHSVKVFASFFIPFYFFYAGLQITPEDMSLKAIILGLLFLIAVTPLRLGAALLQRRIALSEDIQEAMPVAVSLLPTLVFGLVLSGILREVFAIPPYVFGGLIIYTILVTVIPAFVLKTQPISVDAVMHPEDVRPLIE
jgi:Kef-type K+ transport system membrane component KefB